MSTLGFLLGPTCQLGGTNLIRVRAYCNLGESDHINSVELISIIGKQRVGQANSVGPNRSFQWDRNVTKGKQKVCIANSVGPIAHLGWTETLRRETKSFHLGETEVTRVSGSGYVNWTRWRRIWNFGGAELDFLVWDICGYEKVVEGLWSISLSILSKNLIKQHLIPS